MTTTIIRKPNVVSSSSAVSVTNLVVSTIRNDWGWYTASAFVNGYLLSMRYDRRPTKKQAKADLIALYEKK